MSGNNYSLYFHIPFCQKKCHYCHFYVIPNKKRFQEKLFQGLKLEWERVKSETVGKNLTSIYFGGGTPSLFDLTYLREILSWIPLEGVEITLEANPEDLTKDKAKIFREIGINRLSIGVQSFDDALLKKIGRLHSSRHAIDACFSSGFDNLSIDLMYDLPGQTLDSWKRSLNMANSLPISHISLYNLTIEPHTLFYKERQKIQREMPNQEMSLQMYEMAQEILPDQYEISAFGTPSIHNSGYWTGRPFLGLGPAAFSDWEGARFKNISNLNRYHQLLMKGSTPVDFKERLDKSARKRERLAINLRLIEGVQNPDIDQEGWKIVDRLIEDGLLIYSNQRVSLTKKGILFYDTVASEIV